jgi:hypothetical protein
MMSLLPEEAVRVIFRLAFAFALGIGGGYTVHLLLQVVGGR